MRTKQMKREGVKMGDVLDKVCSDRTGEMEKRMRRGEREGGL
jgi:hypothetical protein